MVIKTCTISKVLCVADFSNTNNDFIALKYFILFFTHAYTYIYHLFVNTCWDKKRPFKALETDAWG